MLSKLLQNKLAITFEYQAKFKHLTKATNYIQKVILFESVYAGSRIRPAAIYWQSIHW